MKQFGLVLWLLMGGCAASPEATLFEQALTRRGGSDRLLRIGGLVRKSSGNLRGAPYNSVTTYRYPNLLRLKTEFEGSDVVIEQVFDGQVGYQQIGDRKLQLDEEGLRIIRNRCMDESVFWLLVLEDPNLTLAVVERAEFQDQPAQALRVEHWTGYSRDLFFDSETRELLGSQGMTWTELGRAMTTTIYSDYQEISGIRLPMRQQTLIDGQPFTSETHHSIVLENIPAVEDFLFR